MAQYRQARQEDADSLYEFLLEMYGEVAFAPLSEESARQEIARCIDSGHTIIAEVDGELAGSVGVAVGGVWYSDAPILMDSWFFVTKKHRKSMIAVGMLKRVREGAKAAGLPLAMGVYSKGDIDRKNALFRRFMTPVGEMFVEGF